MTVTDPATVASIAVQHLFDLSIDFDQMQVFATPLGTRMVAVVGRGRADGPAIHGEVLPGGGDWLLVGADGFARLDVRATIRTDDDAMVFMTSSGRVRLPDGSRDRFLLGETVHLDEMFARTTPVFESGADAYVWLNGVVAVGVVTELAQSHIRYQVYGLD